jgi:hypothetical protein
MNTWTHKNGKLWLRDFLPAKVPDARIMTFGYNANIIGSLNNSGIMEHALALLERVLNKRVDEVWCYLLRTLESAIINNVN